MQTTFEQQIEQFGPNGPQMPATLPAAEDYCRKLTLGHYENFPVLSIALPKEYRQDFSNVYAFCRWADDLGDEITDSPRSLELLNWWQHELDNCFNAQSWHPVFVALHKTIVQRQLPQQPFDDLISAFRQDQTVTEYETFDQLVNYCQRSANPVGRIILRICNCATDENIKMSDDVCTGLQLINFWQDVARDFDIGRIYLPQADREQFNYSRSDLENRVQNTAFIDLMKFQVDRAKSLLQSGLPLARRMPGRMKPVIAMFALGGLTICDRVEAIGYRVWDQRPKLTKADGARILTKAICASASFPHHNRRNS